MFHTLGNHVFKVPIKNQIHINQSERVNLFLNIDVVKKDHWSLQNLPITFKAKIQLDWELSTGHIVSRDKEYQTLV